LRNSCFRLAESILAGAAFIGALAACGGSSSSRLPDWARHIEAATVVAKPNATQVVGRVTAELEKRELPAGYVAPEQIAVVAIRELEAGHDWDASVLLAVASYRYHRVAMRAKGLWFSSAIERAGRIDVEAYGKILTAEVGTYNDLDFDDEIKAASARASGEKAIRKTLGDALRRMVAGEPSTADDVKKDLVAKLAKIRDGHRESLVYPGLADAFRTRLTADLESNGDDSYALFYLSQTPLAAFPKAALERTTRPFVTPLVRRLAAQSSHYRAELLAALGSSRAMSRANAAIALGLADEKEQMGVIAAALESETDERVRSALRYSLIRLGQREPFDALVAGLRRSDPELVELTVRLIEWLPADLEAEVDPALLVAIIESKKATKTARRFALTVLGEAATKKPLPDAAVAAIFHACGDENETVAKAAQDAVGQLDQLDRGLVVRRLKAEDGEAREALFERLADSAQLDDLPLLVREFEKADEDGERSVIAAAAAKIHSDAARDQLSTWYRKHEGIRSALVWQLLQRPPRRAGALEEGRRRERRYTGRRVLARHWGRLGQDAPAEAAQDR